MLRKIYIARWERGYCATFDAKERDDGSVSTLCQHRIILPLSINEYEGFEPQDGLKLCRWCKKSINFINSGIDTRKLLSLAQNIPGDTIRVLFDFLNGPEEFTESQADYINQLIADLGLRQPAP